MAKILDFQVKEKFTEQFKGTIPDNILDAYDRISKLIKQYPETQIVVPPVYESSVNELSQSYKQYAVLFI